MLSFNNKNPNDIDAALVSAGITIFFNDGAISSTNDELAQAIIDALPEPMPDLNPRQFLLLLIKANIDIAVDQLLPQLRTANFELYGQIKSQMDRASWFEWDKSLAMVNQLKIPLLQINPALNLSESYLRQLWIEVRNSSSVGPSGVN